jgi:hypothetical protein
MYKREFRRLMNQIKHDLAMMAIGAAVMFIVIALIAY